tara:strand:+ start:4647 stop:4943 length:297 start_codon:yes stop_codon:yes gene_type:complete
MKEPLHRLPLDEWFDDVPHPYDEWPMATDKTPVERLHDDMRKEYENPRPEEDIADDITMHEKMYRIATSRYNPFSVGGSENCHSDVECNIGGSENLHK